MTKRKGFCGAEWGHYGLISRFVDSSLNGLYLEL